MSGAVLLSAAVEATPEVTSAPVVMQTATNMRPLIIGGLIVGFILAVVLAVHRANKIYGKEW